MWWFGKRQDERNEEEIPYDNDDPYDVDQDEGHDEHFDGLSMTYHMRQDWNLISHSAVVNEIERVSLMCFPEDSRIEALDELKNALQYQLDHAAHHPGHDAELMHGNVASILFNKLAICLATNPSDRELFLIFRCLALFHQHVSDHVVELVYSREVLPLVVKVLLLPFTSSCQHAVVDDAGGHRHMVLPSEGWDVSSCDDYYTRKRFLASSGQRSSEALKAAIQDLCHILSQYTMVSESAKVDFVHHPDMLFALLCVMDENHGMTIEARQGVLATLNYISESPEESVRDPLRRDFLPLLRKVCQDEQSPLSSAAQRQAQMTLANLTGGAYIQMSHLRSNSCQSLDLLQWSSENDGTIQKPKDGTVWDGRSQGRPVTPIGVNQFRTMSRNSSSNSLNKLGLGFKKASLDTSADRNEDDQQSHPYYTKHPDPYFIGFEDLPISNPAAFVAASAELQAAHPSIDNYDGMLTDFPPQDLHYHNDGNPSLYDRGNS